MNLHALVLYKTRPARILQIDKKLEIELEDKQTVSVRPKDVILLHPDPLRHWADLQRPSGDPLTAWELLAGEETNLAELAELSFDRFTPASAWAIWEMVADGLYFSGSPEAIQVRTPEQVAAEQANRAAKAAEDAAWQAFVARAKTGHYLPEDETYLQEIVAVALEREERSRVMRGLGQAETAVNAHAFLLQIGYWTLQFNPYPLRFNLPTQSPQISLPPLPDEARRDLTHLTAVAIDDAESRDPDDAISLDEDGRLWVHVADPAAVIPPDSPADLEARARGATIYLPEGAVTMLPAAATDQLALGLAKKSPALSFGLRLNDNAEIVDVDVIPSWTRVVRWSYEEADAALDQGEPLLTALYQLAERYMARRRAQGSIELNLPEVKVWVEADGTVGLRPLPALRSRDLVREAMLMTGEAVAQFAQAREIPIAYTGQDAPDEELPELDSLAAMFAARRKMKAGQQRVSPVAHAGLGLPHYVQVTSPLRRYLDLVAHQQLRAFVQGRPLLDEAALVERIGAANAVVGDGRRAERFAIAHWTLVYLQQNPEWAGEGIIVDKRGSRDLVLIPDLAWEALLHVPGGRPLDSPISLKLHSVNLPEQEAYFHAK
jgi:exoribonuclease II